MNPIVSSSVVETTTVYGTTLLVQAPAVGSPPTQSWNLVHSVEEDPLAAG